MPWSKTIAGAALALTIGGLVWFFWPVDDSAPALPNHFRGRVVTPQATIRFYVIKVGYSADVDYRQVIEGGEARRADLPTLVFFIDHPRGKVLIDSGYGRRFQQLRARFPCWLLFKLIRPTVPPEWSLDRQLARIGVRLEDITHIVLTHAHNDHAGGVQDCLRAKVFMPRAEWDYATGNWSAAWHGFIPEQLDGVADRVVFVAYRPHTPYGPFEQSYDLFGDGSIVLVSTPGHTAGSQGVFVNLPSGRRFFLAGDTAWVADNYRRPAPKSRFVRRLGEYDERAVWENLWRIHRLAELAPDIIIIPGHDPDVDAHLKHLPEFYQ